MSPSFTVLLCSTVVVCAGCHSTRKPQRVETFNPMPSLWAGIRQSIDTLESNHAPVSEWDAASDSATRIETRAELDAVLSNITRNGGDKQTMAEWDRWSPVVHYGFECDYHALVFFEKGRASRVFKW